MQITCLPKGLYASMILNFVQLSIFIEKNFEVFLDVRFLYLLFLTQLYSPLNVYIPQFASMYTTNAAIYNF